ncbi:unnamed protein product [Kuraishia capsulata CBS 1993]|uniref:Uncharacterized protein n=1 Tax=Kuraishia capsulata CBS 1993 TaxID=1382522 RepID=W6MSR9_9ASCO|nr:uncharacterized protein KUCA_T00000792001 [Kuraishia capsulata CBS 1993]CDK24825.1 unnamed protein product [Kuraishia capsulata CBS 1993]
MATPPQFIWENGLRKVVPYYYTDSVRTKGRWVGRTVYDVFTTEFRNKTEDYYVSRVNLSIAFLKHHVTDRRF